VSNGPLARAGERPAAAANPSSEGVVRAAARGDERAWCALVDEFSPVLRRVIGGFRLDAHLVEDVVQVTWIRLLVSIRAIAEPAAVPGWLVTTARREAIRALRDASRRELLLDAPPPSLRDGTPPADEQLVAAERRDALRAAVRRLPARQRALAEALLSEQAPDYAALAEALGMPIGSLGPIRARCLARLRRDPGLLRAVA
jgi:RNA polymerase sigma factor (sigma-70 family)